MCKRIRPPQVNVGGCLPENVLPELTPRDYRALHSLQLQLPTYEDYDYDYNGDCDRATKVEVEPSRSVRFRSSLTLKLKSYYDYGR